MQGEFSIPNFYEYLETRKGKGAALSDTELDSLRKEYTRYRNRLYKKRQREQNREVVIFLNREEHRILKEAAGNHKLILAHYIRHGALKYTNSTYITPNAITLSKLLGVLQSIGKGIDTIARRKKGFLSRDTDYTDLSALITDMQNSLLSAVTKPINAEQWILNEIEQNPAFKRKIIALILSNV